MTVEEIAYHRFCADFGDTFQWAQQCRYENLTTGQSFYEVTHCYGFNPQSGVGGFEAGAHIGACVTYSAGSVSAYINVGSEATIGASHSASDINFNPFAGTLSVTHDYGVGTSIGGHVLGAGVEWSSYVGGMSTTTQTFAPQTFDYHGIPGAGIDTSSFGGYGTSYHTPTFDIPTFSHPTYSPPTFDMPHYDVPHYDATGYGSIPGYGMPALSPAPMPAPTLSVPSYSGPIGLPAGMGYF